MRRDAPDGKRGTKLGVLDEANTIVWSLLVLRSVDILIEFGIRKLSGCGREKGKWNLQSLRLLMADGEGGVSPAAHARGDRRG